MKCNTNFRLIQLLFLLLWKSLNYFLHIFTTSEEFMNILALASSGNNSGFWGLWRELHYHYYPRSHSVALVVATLAIILRTFLELSKLSSKLSSKHNEYQLMMNALLRHIPNQGLILARNKNLCLNMNYYCLISVPFEEIRNICKC